eukprot:7811055-Pyramimonas_sp.AAC.1
MRCRALGVGASRAQQFLQPLSRRIPRDQQQFDSLLDRMRACGHSAETVSYTHLTLPTILLV